MKYLTHLWRHFEPKYWFDRKLSTIFKILIVILQDRLQFIWFWISITRVSKFLILSFPLDQKFVLIPKIIMICAQNVYLSRSLGGPKLRFSAFRAILVKICTILIDSSIIDTFVNFNFSKTKYGYCWAFGSDKCLTDGSFVNF